MSTNSGIGEGEHKPVGADEYPAPHNTHRMQFKQPTVGHIKSMHSSQHTLLASHLAQIMVLLVPAHTDCGVQNLLPRSPRARERTAPCATDAATFTHSCAPTVLVFSWKENQSWQMGSSTPAAPPQAVWDRMALPAVAPRAVARDPAYRVSHPWELELAAAIAVAACSELGLTGPDGSLWVYMAHGNALSGGSWQYWWAATVMVGPSRCTSPLLSGTNTAERLRGVPASQLCCHCSMPSATSCSWATPDTRSRARMKWAPLTAGGRRRVTLPSVGESKDAETKDATGEQTRISSKFSHCKQQAA